ncbi:hypothetical protein BVG16_06085 [Paenibacillus selenitireducens]|uniref:histidine kinase n=1 Tax=Paenibacillus selenitireducens TaxID=1324314 RepID=A0A1T2XKF1_9BACL|nr:HAMP domain-containing sensor histidine kinase [Paenibacillus selenitireducens]OPA80302.1 hypothetical protein BVG16_06085 [Paenibacillus selenitireducens]
MIKLPNMKFGIFAKILMTFVGFLIVSLLILAFVFNWFFRGDLMKSHRDQDLKQLDDIRRYIEQAYQEGWSTSSVKAGLRLVTPQEIRSLYLLDRRSGQILMQISNPKSPELRPTSELIQEVLRDTKLTNNRYMIENENGKANVVAGSVMLNGQPQWTVMLISKSFQADFSKSNSRMALALGITLIVCFLFTLILSRQLTRRVKQLTEATRAIAKGNFTPDIRVNSKDELGELARTVQQMGYDLESLDRMRKEFVANVSHDLRSPLTSMNGYIEAILDGTVPEKRMKHYLGIVQDLNGRLIRLVNDLLDMSKIDSGQLEMHFGPFNVTETIRQVLASMESQFVKHQVIFRVFPQEEKREEHEREEIYVYGDPDRIKQVLTNLIQNAIEFSPDGNSILVDLVESDGAVISVKDHGIGMEKEQLERIWERFYKADEARTRRNGTGIGLSIVKTIIERHGSDIQVDSVVGEGTKFTFTLPFAEDKGKTHLVQLDPE